ncbi:signal peptidase I [uncultured Thiodictyon sp.]|uniref:signal peptidase I n=1 Tax=uncultured Thiodictyon sp. TaxID=1846217 RepID=UPI0025EF9015|nr:signal peptidase I [uncultured Thiodictyon sp.]
MTATPRPNPLATSEFWRRAGPVLLVLAVLGLYLGTRFRLAIDGQVHHCLPPYTVWLIDRHDRRLVRGAPVAFVAGNRMEPFFGLDQSVIKRLAGIPGDHVAVTAEHTTSNGIQVGTGLALAATLGRPASDFIRTETVPADAVWMMGDTPDSYDARYWGALPLAQIRGRAYALF